MIVRLSESVLSIRIWHLQALDLAECRSSLCVFVNTRNDFVASLPLAWALSDGHMSQLTKSVSFYARKESTNFCNYRFALHCFISHHSLPDTRKRFQRTVHCLHFLSLSRLVHSFIVKCAAAEMQWSCIIPSFTCSVPSQTTNIYSMCGSNERCKVHFAFGSCDQQKRGSRLLWMMMCAEHDKMRCFRSFTSRIVQSDRRMSTWQQ